MRPLISIVEHLRRELAWGMSPLVSPPNLSQTRTIEVLEIAKGIRPIAEPNYGIGEPGMSLGRAILRAIETIEHLIIVAFRQSISSSARVTQVVDKMTIQQVADALVAARDTARENLKQMFDDLDSQQQESGEFPDELFDHCLAMIALLQVRILKYPSSVRS